MLSKLIAPKELVLLMRVIALLGAAKIATVIYYDLLFPTEPTADEIAASEEEIRRIAEAGEARIFADFRKHAPGVTRAMEKCVVLGDEASCRWSDIWIERYHLKAVDVLAAASEHAPETVAAAQRYRQAFELRSTAAASED